MNVDHRKDILDYIAKSDRFNGENDAFINSVNKLPKFDYGRFYSRLNNTPDIIEQGDVMPNMPIVNLPKEGRKEGKALVISSTCDINPSNERQSQMNIVYAPMMKFSAYVQLIRANNKYSDTHVQSIRKQQISRFVYLPKGNGLDDEYIAMIDKVCSCSYEIFDKIDIDQARIVRLSDFGWYILLEQLSLFFTRTTDDTIALRFQA